MAGSRRYPPQSLIGEHTDAIVRAALLDSETSKTANVVPLRSDAKTSAKAGI